MNHFSNSAHWVGTLFMFLGGLPFLLFVSALQGPALNTLHKEIAQVGFTYLFLSHQLYDLTWLVMRDGYEKRSVMELTLRVSMFNIVSNHSPQLVWLRRLHRVGRTANYLVCTFLAMAGACSGSTSGGIKIFRFQIAMTMLTSK